MYLTKLIDQGEKLEKVMEEEIYSEEILKQLSNKWINRSIVYLKENYQESILTSDFIDESQKRDKNYHNMTAILKGLKDVEEESGLL